MFEYIRVIFEEHREVVIDDNDSGYFTGDVAEVSAGIHTVTLAGAQDFSPEKHEIDPVGTSPLAPLELEFTKV